MPRGPCRRPAQVRRQRAARRQPQSAAACPHRSLRRCRRRWDSANAPGLLIASELGGEGLDPADYDPAGLEAAMAPGDPMALSEAATERFNNCRPTWRSAMCGRSAGSLARHRPGPRRRARTCCFARALAQHRVGDALTGCFRPTRNMRRSRRRCEITPATDTAKLNRIRLNMDRWRWLPRDLGAEIYHRQRSGLPRHPGRERREPVEAPGDRGRDQDPDAAAHRRWPPASSSTRGGKSRRASLTRSRARRASCREGQGRQVQRWRQPRDRPTRSGRSSS